MRFRLVVDGEPRRVEVEQGPEGIVIRVDGAEYRGKVRRVGRVLEAHGPPAARADGRGWTSSSGGSECSRRSPGSGAECGRPPGARTIRAARPWPGCSS